MVSSWLAGSPQLDPLLLSIFAGLFGLLIGSFLNVVIHRLPIMMMREWRSQCTLLLASDDESPAAIPHSAEIDAAQDQRPPFNILVPRSRCPKCQSTIAPWQNIPVIGYLMLKGRCGNCHNPISSRYPLVEIITGLLFVICSLSFTSNAAIYGSMIFCAILVVLFFIDFDTQLLPDNLTLPLLWLGLLLNLNNTFVTIETAVWGAVAGYLALWIIFQLFKLLTGKEGMGHGDFKLLAAVGAWIGWQTLPLVVVLASVSGSIIIIMLIALGKLDRSKPFAFGPFLAVGGLLAHFWGNQIISGYLSLL